MGGKAHKGQNREEGHARPAEKHPWGRRVCSPGRRSSRPALHCPALPSPSSHSMASRSRWFVGSSSNSRSGSWEGGQCMAAACMQALGHKLWREECPQCSLPNKLAMQGSRNQPSCGIAPATSARLLPSSRRSFLHVAPACTLAPTFSRIFPRHMRICQPPE